MLNFNSKGYLTPNKNLHSNINELYEEFVERIPTPERKVLYENYLSYSNDLKKACGNMNLLQWIDGSFVTKKSKPRDIDVVTFIDYNVNCNISEYVYPNSLKNYDIDAYIVRIYPRNHPKVALYMGDWTYWMDRFDKTRRNRVGNRYPKGFLELIY